MVLKNIYIRIYLYGENLGKDAILKKVIYEKI